jgi:hypothetical protein
VQIIEGPDAWPPADVGDATPAEQVQLASASAKLFVAECDGQDVSTFNFRPPSAANLAAAHAA